MSDRTRLVEDIRDRLCASLDPDADREAVPLQRTTPDPDRTPVYTS